MKIYFAGSIRGGREYAQLYAGIIAILSRYGQVLTEHVGSPDLPTSGEEDLDSEFIYQRDINWFNQSDVLIADVTAPSLGVGYEIRYAIERNKSVLCLYHPQEDEKLSAMIASCPNLTVAEY